MQPLSWLRDFGIMGAGIGGIAPLVALIPMSIGLDSEPFYLMAVFISIGGGLMGLAVGAVLGLCWQRMSDHPLLLAPMGFPVGATAGGIVGAVTGSFLHDSAIPVVGLLGLITGGLVLGFTWLPYLALRSVGRSGLPVVLGGVVFSPLMGLAAFVSILATGV